MKKTLVLTLITAIFFTACSLDNDINNNFYLEVVPIDSVVMPETFVYGETYQIEVNYTRPNDCYIFNDFIYDINANERTVAVVNSVYSNSTCNDNEELTSVSFNFKVTSYDTYLFKFYQGEDEQEEDQYLILEVPVIQ